MRLWSLSQRPGLHHRRPQLLRFGRQPVLRRAQLPVHRGGRVLEYGRVLPRLQGGAQVGEHRVQSEVQSVNTHA